MRVYRGIKGCERYDIMGEGGELIYDYKRGGNDVGRVRSG
jgi:hypothetical protein